MVVSVGPRGVITGLLPRLRSLSGRHVTTLERVHVVRRDGLVLGDLPAIPTHDDSGLGIWQRVMVFCGEQARWQDGPLYSHLLRRLCEADAAGATVLRGTIGFSDDTQVHGDRPGRGDDDRLGGRDRPPVADRRARHGLDGPCHLRGCPGVPRARPGWAAGRRVDARGAIMSTTSRRPAALDFAVLEVLGHRRYGGAHMPVWRIQDALAVPLTPAAIWRSLERLEAEGRVERRRSGADQIEWRVAVAQEVGQNRLR